MKVQNLKFHFSSTDPIPPIPQDSEENYKNMASIVIGKLHFKKMWELLNDNLVFFLTNA